MEAKTASGCWYAADNIMSGLSPGLSCSPWRHGRTRNKSPCRLYGRAANGSCWRPFSRSVSCHRCCNGIFLAYGFASYAYPQFTAGMVDPVTVFKSVNRITIGQKCEQPINVKKRRSDVLGLFFLRTIVLLSVDICHGKYSFLIGGSSGSLQEALALLVSAALFQAGRSQPS